MIIKFNHISLVPYDQFTIIMLIFIMSRSKTYNALLALKWQFPCRDEKYKFDCLLNQWQEIRHFRHRNTSKY